MTNNEIAERIANLPINLQTASYTLALSDAGRLVRMDVASANTLTVPPNSSVAIPIGRQVMVSQAGLGQVTFTPGSGVTINSSFARLKTSAQHAVACLVKVDTNVWLLSGDLTL